MMKNKYFDNREDFNDALEKLYLEQIVPAIKSGLCASILTEVSDIEDETNGLLTYDRKILKVDQERFSDISKKLYETFEKEIKS